MTKEEEADILYEEFLEIACMTTTGAKQSALITVDKLLELSLNNFDSSMIKRYTSLKTIIQEKY